MDVQDITVEQVRELLNYDPATGLFTWRSTRNHKAKIGQEAGYICNGYRSIEIFTFGIRANRLAWFYMKGVWPEGVVDHRDGDKLNNIFNNLRDVTQQFNMHNQRKPSKQNKVGFLGVSKCGKRFRAQIEIDCVNKHIGVYDTPEEAHAAYLEKKRELHGGYLEISQSHSAA